MLAYKCDLCKKYYDGNRDYGSFGLVVAKSMHGTGAFLKELLLTQETESYNLCPVCRDSFEEWKQERLEGGCK